MTKHTDSSRSTDCDSSAPNYPELTRLSGEQAEERTAREGRAREWYRAQLPPPPECMYCGKPMSTTPTAAGIFQYCPRGPAKWQGCTYTFTSTSNLDDGIVECLAAYAESECSCLASRVEELEKEVEHWKANHAECVRRKRVKDEVVRKARAT